MDLTTKKDFGSALLAGIPGRGKTTLLRKIARMLAANRSANGW
jgi:stage III sporulation protein SpoIIIAA